MRFSPWTTPGAPALLRGAVASATLPAGAFERAGGKGRAMGGWRRSLAAGIAAVVLAGPVLGQVVTDGTVGPARSLDGPNYAITPDLGTQRGGNLFHSFALFGVPTGGSATFSGPAGIGAVIARVTGGSPSGIDGKLASTITGADLFLINPSGIVFGPNATLDVGGSFHASTAERLDFGDGGRFDARTPSASVLSVAPPASFGFGENPASLASNGALLAVRPGRTLSFSAGDVAVNGGVVWAPRGTVSLAATGGAGAVAVANGAMSGTGGAREGGTVRVANRGVVTSSGNGGGAVRIRGGALEVEAGSFVSADNLGSSAATGGVSVDAGSVTVRGQITANAQSSGAGGTITINAGSLRILGDGQTVNTLVAARSNRGATGDAGTVVVNADRVEIRYGGQITASSLDRGHAGSIIVNAGETLLSHDDSADSTGTGLFSLSTNRSGGDAGSIVVTGGALSLRGGAQISTRSGSAGRAGTIQVRVDHLSITGFRGENGSTIVSQNTPGTPGDSGSVTIVAKDIEIRDGGRIGSNTRGAGNGGTVTVIADSIVLSDGLAQVDTGIDARANSTSTGNGGTVTITAGRLEILGGATINTATTGTGSAGTITINAGELVIDGTETPAGTVTGISSSAASESGVAGAGGAGGAITINARSVEVSNGGQITATSSNPGVAGDISINVSDRLVNRRGTIATSASRSDGGNIAVTGGDILLLSEGQITTSVAGGAGNGGNIVVSGQRFGVSNRGTVLANAQGGNGGNIIIASRDVLSSPGTRVEASSQLGVSGTVNVQAPDTEVGTNLVSLSTEFSDATALLQAGCGARGSAGRSSSLSGGGFRHAADRGPRSAEAAALVDTARGLWRRKGKAATEEAFRALDRAAVMAGRAGDRRTESLAWGTMGTLYEAADRRADAGTLTGRAIAAAVAAGAPDSLYQWQWQAARLAAAAGDAAGAAALYEQALATLEPIRGELSAEGGESVFRERIEPVYQGYAALLLARGGEDQDTLRRARAVMERLKAAELADYFKDDCLAELETRARPIDRLAPRVAALYPVLLADRTELLVSIGDTIRRVTVPVPRPRLTRTVNEFRALLEKRATHQYMVPGRQLYDWLVRPLEPALAAAAVDTLVIVPDGPLRTIPLAALHDGERFLIERYAVSVSPGLTLIDPQPLRRDGANALVVGLSAAVQGFPALPQVTEEVARIAELFPTRALTNDAFRADALANALRRDSYAVVHIASHGEFRSDAGSSFLLTWDGKLTLDRLEAAIKLGRYRADPVELLVLSACRTAAGDDRAALGLAGVAIKAGARSALASLWYVSDDASSDLMQAFYGALRAPGGSRADALRTAQRALLADARHRHPFNWSAFLLIGNWL